MQRAPVQLVLMSFQDDAVEPLAVESAEHFAQILRRVATREEGTTFSESVRERAERRELRRALPRDLGT